MGIKALRNRPAGLQDLELDLSIADFYFFGEPPVLSSSINVAVNSAIGILNIFEICVKQRLKILKFLRY